MRQTRMRSLIGAGAVLLLAGCGTASATSAPTSAATTKTVKASSARAVFSTGTVNPSDSADVRLAKMVHNLLPGTTDKLGADLGLSDDQILKIARHDCDTLAHVGGLRAVLKSHAAYAQKVQPKLSWDKESSLKFLTAATFAQCPNVSIPTNDVQSN